MNAENHGSFATSSIPIRYLYWNWHGATHCRHSCNDSATSGLFHPPIGSQARRANDMTELTGMRVYVENNWLVVRDGTGKLVWSYPLPNIDGLLLADIVNECAATLTVPHQRDDD